MSFLDTSTQRREAKAIQNIPVQKPEMKVEKPTQPGPRKSIWKFEFEDRFQIGNEVEMIPRIRYAISRSVDFKNMIDMAYAAFLINRSAYLIFPLPVHLQQLIAQPEIYIYLDDGKVFIS